MTKYIASVKIGMDLQSEDISVFEEIRRMITQSLTDGIRLRAIEGRVSIDSISFAKASDEDKPT